jgi:arylsulfatase A-like enzyme
MTRKPNILFLLPDQLRPDFLGCYGADFLQTPAIDGLAASGTRYDTAISPCPICVPARASMLTGQAAHASGVIHNLAWPRPDRRQMGVETWPEKLGQAGYRTAAIGKMHFYPWDISEGFQTRIIAEDKRHLHIRDDYYYALAAEGFEKEHAKNYAGYEAQKGACVSPLPDHLQPDRWVANQAADCIRHMRHDQPFAMMVGFPGPHCPYDPPAQALDRIDPAALPAAIPPTEESHSHHAEFLASYKRPWADIDYSSLSREDITTIRHHYAALTERLDEDVATILEALRDSGHLDNTIVVFASDHGDYLGDFGLVGKGYFHDPSIKVPLIVTDFRAPGAAVHADPVSLLDLFPSFVDWADVTPSLAATGVTLGTRGPRNVIVGMTALGMMARNRNWKLVRYKNGTEALFDLQNDPREQTNVITAHPDIRADLDMAMMRDLLGGLNHAYADNYVADAKAPAGHPFHERHWDRPYPSHIGVDASSA